MCMKATTEGCVLQAQQDELKAQVKLIDKRLTKVEADVGKIRTETQDGFKHGEENMRAISAAVADLGHDLGEGMDKRLVTEKEKWGDTFRWVVKIVVRLLVAGCAVAMGVTAVQHFMKN